MLVLILHELVLLGFFTVFGPVINTDIGISLCLDPHTGAAEPPHGNRSGSHRFLFYFFVKPGSPLREISQYPRLPGNFINFTHYILLLLVAYC